MMRQNLLRGLVIGLLPVVLITGCNGKQTQKHQSKEEAIVWGVDASMHRYMKENYGDPIEVTYTSDVWNNAIRYSLPVETKSGHAVFVYRSDSIFARVYLGSKNEPVKIDCDGCTRYNIEKSTIPKVKEKLEEIKKKAGEAGEKVKESVRKKPAKGKDPYANY